MIRKKKEIIHAARKNLSRPGEFLNAHVDVWWEKEWLFLPLSHLACQTEKLYSFSQRNKIGKKKDNHDENNNKTIILNIIIVLKIIWLVIRSFDSLTIFIKDKKKRKENKGKYISKICHNNRLCLTLLSQLH